MDDKTAAAPLARDADGKALMSLDELKEGMFQTIRDSGTVELIRVGTCAAFEEEAGAHAGFVQAQLRRRFIEKLQQQRRLGDGQDDENNASRANRDASISTPDEKLVHGLVAEYLASKGLENTLAVFVPEIGGARNQVDSATILEVRGLRVAPLLPHLDCDCTAACEAAARELGHAKPTGKEQELAYT
jgi:hypothetical protein